MKVALVSQEYPPDLSGGIATQTLMKAEGLSRLSHQVFVICRSMDGSRYESKVGDVTVIRIPGMEVKGVYMSDIVQWITYSVNVAAEIEALHERVSLKLVDFAEWAAEGYIWLLNRCEWNYIPAVIQLHGPLVMFSKTMNWPEVNSEFYRAGTHMEATCIRLADGVYSSSECSAEWVRLHYDCTRKNIPVIHMGIDTTTFSPLQESKNIRPTIIFVGKFVPNKGVIELVEVACNLVKEFPDLCLRMIGPAENDLMQQLHEKAVEFGASDLLELSGYMCKEDLAKELSRAHIFAAPSHYEGGPGFVYLEAMACGLPVVACSGSGIDEIVISGENGFLIPRGDIKALEEILRKLLLDKTLVQRISSNARNYVLREVDSDHCIKKLEVFYYSVLSNQTAQMKAVQL